MKDQNPKNVNSKAARIPWDEQETAILIDGYLATQRGELSRAEAVSQISSKLRIRAVNKGLEIDDIYRNENGISMQMTIIADLFKGGFHLHPASRLFSKMVKMYKRDRGQFDKILDQALSGCEAKPEDDRLNDFKEKLDSAEDVSDQDSMDQKSWIKYDFTNANAFIGTVPAYCRIRKTVFEGKSWSEIYAAIVNNEIMRRNPEIQILYNYSFDSMYGNRRFFFKDKIDGQACVKLVNGLWICVEYSIPVLINKIEVFCVCCNYKRADIELYGKPDGKGDSSNGEEVSSDASGDELANSYGGLKTPGGPVLAYCRIGSHEFTAETWGKVLIEVVEYEIRRHNPALTSLKQVPLHGTDDIYPFFTNYLRESRYRVATSNGSYVCLDYSDEELRKRITEFAFCCGHDKYDIEFSEIPADVKQADTKDPDTADSVSVPEIASESGSKTEPAEAGSEEATPSVSDDPNQGTPSEPDKDGENYLIHCLIGDTEIADINWQKLYIDVVEHEINRKNPVLALLKKRPLPGSGDGVPFFLSYWEKDKNSVRTTNGCCIRINYSDAELCKRIADFAIFCGYDKCEVDLPEGFIPETEYSAGKDVSEDTAKPETDNASAHNFSDEGEKPERIKYDFNNCGDFKETLPVNCTLAGDDINGINWRKVYIAAAEHEIKKHNPVINNLIRKPLPGCSVDRPFFMKEPVENRNCVQLSNGYWIYIHYGIADLVKYIGLFCLACGYSESQIVLYGVKKDSEEAKELLANGSGQDGISTVTSLPADDVQKNHNASEPALNGNDSKYSQKTIERCISILKDEFSENGFRSNNIFDYARFSRSYSERFGDELGIDKNELTLLLKGVGRVTDKHIYAKEPASGNDLIDEIFQTAVQVLDSGASCVYLECLFNRYRERLANELQIYTEEAMTNELVNALGQDYIKLYGYICHKGGKQDILADVKGYLEPTASPVSYDEIGQALWYIPLDKIRFTCSITPEIISTSQKFYMLADNFPLDKKDIAIVREAIQNELLQKEQISDNDLYSIIESNCPSVLIDASDYGFPALKKVLGYYLRDDFSFKSTIISRKGQNINVTNAYENFCRQHESFTYDELKRFSEETCSSIFWDVVYGETVRIDQQNFVRKDKISFDAAKVDESLSGFIQGKYASIQDIEPFLLHLPAAGIKWNSFVLESFVVNYSMAFKLVHNSYSQDGSYGAIVRKDAKIDDYRALITDVLLNDTSWVNSKDALNLIVRRGFQKRRAYSEMDSIVVEVRKMRLSSKK